MVNLIRTKYTWVSVDGFLEFCKDLTKVNSWSNFTEDEVSAFYGKITSYHKVRSNLHFAIALGLVIKINGHYKIDDANSEVMGYFIALREKNIQVALTHLSKIVKKIGFFENIIDNFFYDKKPKSTKELRDFLKSMDENKSNPNYYRQGSRFFSKFLHKLDIVNYKQRYQTVALKGYENDNKTIQKNLVQENVKSQQESVLSEILNEICFYVKTSNDNESLAKFIEALPSEKRIKINSRLLEVVNKK